VFLSRGRVQAVGAGKGVLHPSTPKALFLFVFFNHPEEGNWVGLVSQSVKVLRVGGSNLTV